MPRRLIAVATICWLGSLPAAWAQSAAVQFDSMSDSIRRLGDRGRVETILPSAKITALGAQVGELNSLYRGREDVPVAYTQSLQRDADLLRQAQTMASGDAGRLIDGVASDIALKHQYALSFNAFGGNQAPTLVSVIVEVKRNGQTLTGYIVRWSPELWPDTVVKEFNGNPLKGDLAPGRYILTALTNGNVATQQPKGVGLTQHSSETIDVIVP
jgi:hypothetical protein